MPSSRHGYSHSKLPRLQLPKFSGDPTQWQSFYDSFVQAVDKNPNFSDIEKMKYLLGQLEAEADRRVKGENYVVALELLEKRFGDKQLLVSSHMSKLLSLDVITSITDTSGMRTLYDELTAQVRNLRSLGLATANYGPMLVSVLISKLPEEIKLIISREFNSEEIWDVTKLLEKLKLDTSELQVPSNAFNVHGYQNSRKQHGNNKSRFDNKKARFSEQRNVDNNEKKIDKCLFCENSHNAHEAGGSRTGRLLNYE